jgi:transposase
MPDEPWRNEETLRRLYQDEGMSQQEIAERLGCSQRTVWRWMERYDIQVRQTNKPTGPWTDPELLHDLYHEKSMSQYEIAEELDCGQNTVKRWMKRHDIEAKTVKNDRVPYFETSKNGYETWETKVEDTSHHVRVHRLLAVAEYGFEAVADSVVHHKNNIRWDNRPENIEPMSKMEHRRIHVRESDRDERGRFA